MLKLNKFFAMLIALTAIFIVSCEEETTTTPGTTAVVISSIDKLSGAAGDTITIKGSGFGQASEPGSVIFGTAVADSTSYISWTPTQIKVRVPALPAAQYNKWSTVQVTRDTVKSQRADFYIGNELFLGATSLNDKSVLLYFTRPSAPAANPQFKHFMVTTQTETGTFISDQELAANSSTISIPNLVEGTIYDFSIVAHYTNGDKSAPMRVKWSPASRFTETTNGVALKLYESASANFGSGLDLFDGTSSAVVKVSEGAKWNLGLDTKDANKIAFASAKSIGYNFTGTPESAELSDSYYPTTKGLNDVFDNVALSSGQTFAEKSLVLTELEKEDPGKGFVFIARVKNTDATYNYAKVYLKLGADGKFLQGTAPNRYIEVEVSYQKISGVPYAKR